MVWCLVGKNETKDIAKEKVRKERAKRNGKGKEGQDGNSQGDGKGEANNVNPWPSSSQSSGQQAALPSLSNDSGLFLTHVPCYLQPVEMIGNEEQQKEPASSGYAFYGQEADPVLQVEAEGILVDH